MIELTTLWCMCKEFSLEKKLKSLKKLSKAPVGGFDRAIPACTRFVSCP